MYREIEAEQKKNTLNPRISKLDQIEKEGIKVSLQTEWDKKVQNMTLRHGVNQRLIKYTSYNQFD